MGNDAGSDGLKVTAGKWVDEVNNGASIDKATYSELLTECVDSVFDVSDAEARTRGGIMELAILADDHDLITDMMERISERASEVTKQRELMNVCSEYLYIAAEGFAVYTDLKDLRQICTDAVEFYDRMAPVIDGLEPLEKAVHPPRAFIENFSQFFSILGSKIDSMVSAIPSDKIEFLSDYWAEHSGKMFADIIVAAANANVQLVSMGKLGGKLASKARDLELNRFATTFLAPAH